MCLERYSEVVGLPVICADSGKKIGVVEDIIFCPSEKRVNAFMLERTGYQIGRKVVLMKDVLNLGRDALIVNDDLCVTPLHTVKYTDEFRNKADVKGLRIYTRSGEDLGIVKDVLFDFKTGIIEGVEVSDGILNDLLQGRNVLPLFGKVEFNDKNILVDREAVEEMTSTGGGLKNLVD